MGFKRPLVTLFISLSLFWLPSLSAQDVGLPPASAGTFSIVVLPDTQGYLGKGTKAQPKSQDPLTNPVFDAATTWVVANAEAQRIAFVSHVGDIVDKNVPEQWELARSFMDRIHGQLPYGISVGNHDMKGSGDSSLFQAHFPASRFADQTWYDGYFEPGSAKPAMSGNNANSCQLFSANGLDFVALHLECNAPDDVLAWADQKLEQYAERLAIVTTHMGLGPLQKPKTPRDYFDAPKGRMQWKKTHGKRGNTPQEMWDKCFRKHQNLLFVFSGDQSRTQAMHQTSKGDHGNVVHELMSDYGPNGIRICRFIPAENRVRIYTFDPRKNRLCESTKYVPNREEHLFTLECSLQQR